MRSDLGQRGDCYWAFATAVYSRTSHRSGMRRLWESLTYCIAYWNIYKWRRLVLNGRITFTKLELVPAFLFIKPATKRDLLVNPIAAGTC